MDYIFLWYHTLKIGSTHSLGVFAYSLDKKWEGQGEGEDGKGRSYGELHRQWACEVVSGRQGGWTCWEGRDINSQSGVAYV